ncbi:MAG TPA: threonylcarbamoyl-AMP synthase [Bacteroidales bacterium]|nr:threonylcarbamoyl-AMP synthase [Bacteroidales bacterium]
MLLKIYPENPNSKHIQQVVDCLRQGGVIIYPTDTMYAIGCDLYQIRAVERVAQLKGIALEKANFSIICTDLSNISDYTRPFSNQVYKAMKRALPGPFTFILNASNQVPRIFQSKKKTIGIRIPDNSIPRLIANELGNPIISTTVFSLSDDLESLTDPELLYEEFLDKVDMVIDGGIGETEVSTIVDCTGDEMVVVREGKGDFESLL